jgi:p38 MAP kinase
MLTWQKYDVAVDIWSTGCIFAEMLEGKPLFPGKDRELLYVALCSLCCPPFFLFCAWLPRLDVNQFSIITELLGTPPDDVIETICSENVSASPDSKCLIETGDDVSYEDTTLCSKLAQAGTPTVQSEATDIRPGW